MTNATPDPNDPSNPVPEGNQPSEGTLFQRALDRNISDPHSWPFAPPVSGSSSANATLNASTAWAAMRILERQSPVGGTSVTISGDVRLAEIEAAKEGQKLAHERYMGDLGAIKDDAKGERRIDAGILITGAIFFLIGFFYYMNSKDTTGLSVGVAAGLVVFAYRAGRGKLQPPSK